MHFLPSWSFFCRSPPRLRMTIRSTLHPEIFNALAGLGYGIPAEVHCTIFDRSGPPSISRLAQCNDAPGYEFSMREHGAVTVKCSQVGPSVTPPGNAVRYGGAVRYDGIFVPLLNERPGVPKRRWARLLFVTRATFHLLGR